jgi:uncharacterized protein
MPRRLCLLLFFLPVCARLPPQPVENRLVFELTSAAPKVWAGLVGNVENAQQALGQARIEVVAHGDGLDLLVASKNAEIAERLAQLNRAGVVFAACQNTMQRRAIAPDQLSPFATPVDSGVAELARKQLAGWAYLRIVP